MAENIESINSLHIKYDHHMIKIHYPGIVLEYSYELNFLTKSPGVH